MTHAISSFPFSWIVSHGNAIPNKRIQILSIDGGGVRGIVSLRIISEITRRIGLATHEIFDGFAGTSSGSLLVNGLLLPGEKNGAKYTPDDLSKIIESDLRYIFKASIARKIVSGFGWFKPKYSNKPMVEVINRLGAGALYKDQLSKMLIVPAFNLHTFEPVFFKSHRLKEVDKKVLKVADVVLASSAAPGLLAPYRFKYKGQDGAFIDGGVVCNNPAPWAYFEAKRVFGEDADIHILSIGPGKYTYAGQFNPKTSHGILGLLPHVPHLFFSTIEKFTEYLSRDLIKMKKYERIVIPFDSITSKLDDASERNMNYIKKVTEDWIKENDVFLTQLCHELGTGRK